MNLIVFRYKFFLFFEVYFFIIKPTNHIGANSFIFRWKLVRVPIIFHYIFVLKDISKERSKYLISYFEICSWCFYGSFNLAIRLWIWRLENWCFKAQLMKNCLNYLLINCEVIPWMENIFVQWLIMLPSLYIELISYF